MVAIKPLCEALGIASNNQIIKVKSDPRFKWYDIISVAEDGKQRTMLCIPVRQVSGWLYKINSNKVKPDVAEKLLIFQEHLQIAMHAYVTGQYSHEMTRALQEEIKYLKGVIATKDMVIDSLSASVKGLQEASLRQDEKIDALHEMVLGEQDLMTSSASYRLNAAKKRKQLRQIQH